MGGGGGAQAPKINSSTTRRHEIFLYDVNTWHLHPLYGSAGKTMLLCRCRCGHVRRISSVARRVTSFRTVPRMSAIHSQWFLKHEQTANAHTDSTTHHTEKPVHLWNDAWRCRKTWIPRFSPKFSLWRNRRFLENPSFCEETEKKSR